MKQILKHIPNTITLANLATGATGCYWIVEQNDYFSAIYFVLIASLFDFFDGFVARILKVQSEIGKQLDSLADLISFGMLPGIFMVNWLSSLGSELHLFGMIIVLFSALRLAKFNIDATQTYGFKGLPTPANAIMITSLIFIFSQPNQWILLGISVASSLLLVSDLPLLALKFKTFGWKENEEKWILVFISILGLIVFQLKFISLIIPIYILISLMKKLQKN